MSDVPAPASASAQRLAIAADPAPSSIERGPVARLHWRHGVTTDPDLAAVVAPLDAAGAPALSAEWPAVLAETHAALLDPSGGRPLACPSPVGLAVRESLARDDRWPLLCDVAALHPSIARDAVVGLADVVRGALTKSGAARTDTRRSLADLATARARLEAARARAATATPAERREALADVVAAGKAEELASGAAQAADAAGARVRAALAGDDVGDAIDVICAAAEEQADGVRALAIAGLGSTLGSQDPASVPYDVVALLTPEIAAVLRHVGALRLALRAGRASRHLPGREGCLGPDVGGLDRVGDLVPLARASLAGLLGAPLAALERLRLVEGRSAVIEKGGGKAHKGDVVVVVDKSGSMCGARNDWAAALALAVLLEARAENRVCAVVTYDGAVRASIVVDSAPTMRAAFAAICVNSGGDNNERAALRAAGECLARMRKSGDPADVLMITDGQWEAENLDGANIARARLRAVFIGGSVPPGAKFASAWELRSPEGASALAVEIAATVV